MFKFELEVFHPEVFDISNMYTNIPTHELLSIIDTACNNNLVEESLKRDIINLFFKFLKLNYFITIVVFDGTCPTFYSMFKIFSTCIC